MNDLYPLFNTARRFLERLDKTRAPAMRGRFYGPKGGDQEFVPYSRTLPVRMPDVAPPNPLHARDIYGRNLEPRRLAAPMQLPPKMQLQGSRPAPKRRIYEDELPRQLQGPPTYGRGPLQLQRAPAAPQINLIPINRRSDPRQIRIS